MLFSEKTRSSVYLIPPSDITPEIEDEVINQKVIKFFLYHFNKIAFAIFLNCLSELLFCTV